MELVHPPDQLAGRAGCQQFQEKPAVDYLADLGHGKLNHLRNTLVRQTGFDFKKPGENSGTNPINFWDLT